MTLNSIFPDNLLNITITPKRLAELESELEKIGVPYEIKNNRIYTKGDISFAKQSIQKLPNLTEVIVMGGFYCQYSDLKSLEGAPQYVRGSFICRENNLTSLKGGPQYVGDWFDCQHNNLTDLMHGPKIVKGTYNCNANENMTTLKGACTSSVHEFICLFCDKLEDLEYMPDARYCANTPFGTFYDKKDIPKNVHISARKRVERFKAELDKGMGLKEPLPIKRLRLNRPK